MLNRISKTEGRYLRWVKAQPCGVCGEQGVSEAHHIEQHKQYLCIPLCPDCHRGSFNGLHGQARIWKVKKMSELDVLHDIVKSLADRLASTPGGLED